MYFEEEEEEEGDATSRLYFGENKNFLYWLCCFSSHLNGISLISFLIDSFVSSCGSPPHPRASIPLSRFHQPRVSDVSYCYSTPGAEFSMAEG